MTRNLPANPMQALIAAAARTKSTTDATATYKRRLEASGPQVVLADVSQSMELPAGGSLRRIDHLRSALDAVLQPEHLLMSFASAPQWQPSRDPPDAPKLPWLAVWLLPHIITADRDTLLSLGRVEQAVAMLLMGAP